MLGGGFDPWQHLPNYKQKSCTDIARYCRILFNDAQVGHILRGSPTQLLLTMLSIQWQCSGIVFNQMVDATTDENVTHA